MDNRDRVVDDPVSLNLYQLKMTQVPIIMIRGLYEIFGIGAFSVLWLLGKRAGIRSAISKRELDPEGSIRETLKELESAGWGIFELNCEGHKTYSIRVYDNFECNATLDLKDYQNSFLRGVLCGIISKIFDKDFRCKETECIKKGDESCRFVLE